MKKTHTSPTRALVALLAALCLSAAAAAQPPKESAKEFRPTAAQAAEAARLRRALEMTVGENFEVARASLTRRSTWHGGQLYWLAHLRARRGGGYHVKYKYKYNDLARPEDPLFTFAEHKTFVRVGPKGCDRQPRYNFICVGDTIIVPVLVGEHSEHSFSLVSHPFAPGDPASARALRDAEANGLHKESVRNPAEKFMKYLGSRAHYAPHRSLGFTMTYSATFEAVAPGAFNLSVGLDKSYASPPDPARLSTGGSVPVVVVERGAPVTVLSAKDDVHAYSERFASSGGGTSFITTPVVLQVGERLTLEYHTYSVRGRSAGGETREALEASVKDRPPSITLLPFRVDPARDFNEWVVEFLPPPRRRE